MAPSTRRSRIIAANIRAAISQTNGAPNSGGSYYIDSICRSNPEQPQFVWYPHKVRLVAHGYKHAGNAPLFQVIPLPARLQPLFQLKLPKEYPQSERESPRWKNYGCSTSSFYPGRGDDTHPLASFQVDPGNQFAQDSDPEDNIENEDDWLEDEQTANVARKVSAKTTEVTITERPSWLGAGDIPPQTTQTPNRIVLDIDASGSAASTPRFGTLSELGTPTVEPSATATTSQTEATTESPGATWPTDTDLLPPGAKRLLLTNQQTLVHNVVQEAIENLRASLLFNNAFPTAPIAFAFTKESLITAAEKFKPGATHIQCQLQQDEEYLGKIGPLAAVPVMACHHVSARLLGDGGGHVPVVLERIWFVVTLGYGLQRRASHDLSKSPLTSVLRDLRLGWRTGRHCGVPAGVYDSEMATDTVQQRGLLVGTPARTHPYRNECIISAIRDLFFTGGTKSFASCYNHLFPVHQGRDGTPAREVPAPMVALVATAMYATLHEWRTGAPQVFEFSANTYLEVYRSNTDTLNFILNNRPNAYHLMMADIYTQASSNSGLDDSPNVEIADLDLDNLEE
ncbi:hypothetical protein EDB83DRAFT_2652456 [Lactarius deliciosus]|nr:hypothetical protein EDB83DRAFT_2652456 [Lactarius deliciosus]